MAAFPLLHFLLTCWNSLSYCHKCYSLDLLCQNCHTAHFSLQINYWQLLSSNMWWKNNRFACIKAIWLYGFKILFFLVTANKSRCLRILFYILKLLIHFLFIFLKSFPFTMKDTHLLLAYHCQVSLKAQCPCR